MTLPYALCRPRVRGPNEINSYASFCVPVLDCHITGAQVWNFLLRVAVSDFRGFRVLNFLLKMLDLCSHHYNCEVIPQIKFDLCLITNMVSTPSYAGWLYKFLFGEMHV